MSFNTTPSITGTISITNVNNAGVGEDRLKVIEEQGHLLQEILVENKINNQYQKEIVGDANEVLESDIEISK